MQDLYEREAYFSAIHSAATPARRPHFPELNDGGEWKAWSAKPSFPPEEPASIAQPPWTRNLSKHSHDRRFLRTLRHTQLEDGHIRLLSLEHAYLDTNSTVLRNLKLIDVPLQTAPAYEALSYCWGDLRLCTGILFNHEDGHERVFRITEDLATCLYSIMQSRELTTPAYIWIDQICIDQGNIPERNSQVKIMIDIYRRASRVIVWLGQEAESAGRYQDSTGAGVVPTHILPIDDETGQPDIRRIEDASVLARPWFRRLWVSTCVHGIDSIASLTLSCKGFSGSYCST
jgi:hypothetical protein